MSNLYISPREVALSTGPHWLREINEFNFEDRDFDVGLASTWPDEHDLYRVMAELEDDFWGKVESWNLYLVEHELWLPLEQCCHDGVLLPWDMRLERLKTCPAELMEPLLHMFRACPPHVLHRLATIYFHTLRSDRVRRTGCLEWTPELIPAIKESSCGS